MIIKILSQKRLKRYWGRKLPIQEQEIERFSRVGLLPQDFNLTDLELVCACSLMVERKTIHEVYQAIDRYRNESIESQFDVSFFEGIRETIAEMERKGMRSQARKLRRLGEGIAAMQNERDWQSHWRGEADRKRISSIKDEPFLPQQG